MYCYCPLLDYEYRFTISTWWNRYASNAHLDWKDLQERFDKVNRIRIYELHRAIVTISLGTDSVSIYFTKLKELWAEFDSMAPSPNCSCEKSKDYVEYLHQQ